MWFKHRDKTLGINLDLVKELRITFEDLCQLVELHKERSDLFELLTATKDKTLMKILYKQLTQVEYEVQILWGFEPNMVRHMSWRWPHCICPRGDNQMAFPHMMWVDGKCPLHGDIIKKTKSKTNVTS